MKLLSSNARNEATLAISSGLPIRPRGTVAARLALNCFDLFLTLYQSTGARSVYRTWTDGVDPNLEVFKIDCPRCANDRTAALVAQ